MTRADSIATPQRILLATDLGHRCDRAVDRALTCARAWDAQLLVAVMQEQAFASDAARVERERQLGAMLREEVQADDISLRIRLEHGEPADLAAAIAADEGSELIVTGIARSSPVSDILLGRTVDRVLRKAVVPVLVVRRRGRIDYRRIVVGSDLSEASRIALHTALAWFPQTPLLLFHAYRPPMATRAGSSAQARADMQAAALAACQAFVDDSGLPADARARISIEAEYGEPELRLADCGQRFGADLLVLGSGGRGALFDVLIGSTARRLLDDVDTDVLVVRPPAGDLP